ncbi:MULTISPECIES: hypothetical protein [unclassified Rhizobacter]|uniref:hypothetical protein n=1 Tax=unclassified Rhizobacter TaxID=2640088 RepID=UPI0012FBE2AA|nr:MULTISPECIES: hypothetical protein [unclassified Rhizobacter]
MFFVKLLSIVLFLAGCASFAGVLFFNSRLLDAQQVAKMDIWQRLRIAGIGPLSIFHEARWPDETCRYYVRRIRRFSLVAALSFSSAALLVWVYSLFGVIR